MSKAEIKVLSRQRFFEVKEIIEKYNKDLISFVEFKKLIEPKEAESYEYMFRLAGFNLGQVHFF